MNRMIPKNKSKYAIIMEIECYSFGRINAF